MGLDSFRWFWKGFVRRGKLGTVGCRYIWFRFGWVWVGWKIYIGFDTFN